MKILAGNTAFYRPSQLNGSYSVDVNQGKQPENWNSPFLIDQLTNEGREATTLTADLRWMNAKYDNNVNK